MELTMQSISANDLKNQLKSDQPPALINALSSDDYRSKYIPGSINIPRDSAEFAKNILPEKDQNVVVYCANSDCLASSNLAEELIEMGYKNVWDFEEGLKGWQEAGYTLKGSEV